MDLFYTRPELVTSRTVRIIGDEARHIAKVMRYGPGDRVGVTDGQGLEYLVELSQVSEGLVTARILTRTSSPREPLSRITLAQGVVRGSRMEVLVELATELGVYEVIPMLTSRTSLNPSQARIERWQRIACAAMKSALRSILPKIHPPLGFREVLELSKGYQLSVMAWEGESQDHLRDLVGERPRRILLMVGPEGGFSPDEVSAARGSGVKTFSLGLRRLRSETAGVAAVALLLHELEEM